MVFERNVKRSGIFADDFRRQSTTSPKALELTCCSGQFNKANTSASFDDNCSFETLTVALIEEVTIDD